MMPGDVRFRLILILKKLSRGAWGGKVANTSSLDLQTMEQLHVAEGRPT